MPGYLEDSEIFVHLWIASGAAGPDGEISKELNTTLLLAARHIGLIKLSKMFH